MTCGYSYVCLGLGALSLCLNVSKSDIILTRDSQSLHRGHLELIEACRGFGSLSCCYISNTHPVVVLSIIGLLSRASNSCLKHWRSVAIGEFDLYAAQVMMVGNESKLRDSLVCNHRRIALALLRPLEFEASAVFGHFR